MPPAKFKPRQRKQRHRNLARDKRNQNDSQDVASDGANEQEILPAEENERQEKKARMREELKSEGVKVSGKKAKRLEKYIENKLKKDENRELLAKLASNQVDTSLFSSTRNLGQAKETKKAALSRALKERNAGIATHDDLLYTLREEAELRSSEAEEDADEDENEEHVPNEKAVKATTAVAAPAAAPAETSAHTAQPILAGSGLKRPLDLGEDGRPVIKKRQRRGGVTSKWALAQNQRNESDYDEWSGFDSDEEMPMPMSGKANNLEAGTSQEPTGSNSSEEDESDDSGSEDDDEDDSEEEDDDDDDEKEEEEDDDGQPRSARSSAFKAWAHQQRNEALGYQPTDASNQVLEIPRPENFQPRPIEQDPLPFELQPTTNTSRIAHSVTVTRDPEIQAARLQLPVVAEEQKIMEAIHNHDIVVICGATGSGKTTQVPQFLFEAGYGSPDSPTPGMIGVTQPRRVAAVSMSKRVGQELGDSGHVVAYQIRFEGTVDPKTAVKFMTDGVLLREVAQDIALRKYSAIIIDEAHERSVNTDILIGMLSRVIKLRSELAKEDTSIKPLKLIIMSATLRIEDLTHNPNLFATPPPVLQVEGRQHPVTVHFSRKTRHDYVEEAFKKISRGHKKLPPGGFLVFLTGQNEITQLSKKLKTAFGGGMSSAAAHKVRISANEAPIEAEDIEFGDDRNADVAEDDDYSSGSDQGEDEDDKEFEIADEEAETGPSKMHILPLYSLLPTKEQMRVFEPPPEGSRHVIIATNVAETSLTIPGIRYVFDCGRAKERRYDRTSGVQSFEVGWVSKASANQRSGRAGRTGPGHCYRLYSSAVYERDLPAFADPELLRMPIEGVVLQLKSMNLQHVVNFPFPTPPKRRALVQAERLLAYLSAISTEGQVTQIGSTMSIFPLSPRFARILLVGHLHDCLPYTIALVAGLSAAEIFVPDSQAIPAVAALGDDAVRTNAHVIAENEQANIRKAYNAVHRNFCYLDDKSDAIKLLQVVGEFAHEPTEQWCESHFVRYKVLKEIQQLRHQIVDLLRTNISAFAGVTYQDRLDPPTPKQVAALKQMVTAGFIDQVAIRADKAPVPPETFRKPRRAIDVAYIPLVPLDPDKPGGGGDDAEDGMVYIHPASPLAHLSPGECPDYVVYAHLQRGANTGAAGEKRAKTRMHALTDVTGGQLAALAKGTPLISYGKPIKEVKGSESEDGKTKECWVIPYLQAEGVGGIGWPLPAKKVRQRKVSGKGWVVE